MAEDILRRVTEEIAQYTEASPESIAPDASFEDLGLDSMDAITLITELEEAFDITVSNEEALEVHSIRQVVDLIQNHLAKKAV